MTEQKPSKEHDEEYDQEELELEKLDKELTTNDFNG